MSNINIAAKNRNNKSISETMQNSNAQPSNPKNVNAQNSNAQTSAVQTSSAKNVPAQTSNNANKSWEKKISENNWTTILAYQLQSNLKEKANANKIKKKNIDTLLKYEALLTQCCYLSRMAYSPADIFCRMTEHLDVTPNAFNNYIRTIEKIYQKLFDYKCSYDSQYIQDHPQYEKYFSKKIGIEKINPVGFFIRNNEQLNVYLYVYDNQTCEFNKIKTLFISFKGSSSIQEFKENFLSATWPDKPLSDLDIGSQSGGNGNDDGKSETEPLLPKNSDSNSPFQGCCSSTRRGMRIFRRIPTGRSPRWTPL